MNCFSVCALVSPLLKLAWTIDYQQSMLFQANYKCHCIFSDCPPCVSAVASGGFLGDFCDCSYNHALQETTNHKTQTDPRRKAVAHRLIFSLSSICNSNVAKDMLRRIPRAGSSTCGLILSRT